MALNNQIVNVLPGQKGNQFFPKILQALKFQSNISINFFRIW